MPSLPFHFSTNLPSNFFRPWCFFTNRYAIVWRREVASSNFFFWSLAYFSASVVSTLCISSMINSALQKLLLLLSLEELSESAIFGRPKLAVATFLTRLVFLVPFRCFDGLLCPRDALLLLFRGIFVNWLLCDNLNFSSNLRFLYYFEMWAGVSVMKI